MNKNNTCTKDKRVLFSYSLYIEASLLKLGFAYSSKGTCYFRKMIETVYNKKYEDFKLNDLYVEVSKEFNVPANIIKEDIKSLFKRIDNNKSSKNFEKIFHLPFEYFYITPKNLIILFINTLNRINK